MNNTVVNLVIDAVGIDTLEYILDKSSIPISFPHLESLGLGNLLHQRHHSRIRTTNAELALSINQSSAEADSVIGHREMVGIVDPNSYELFFDGFSPEYISALEKKIGRKTILNQMAGGIEAIEKNRTEHEASGHPIIYSSMCDPIIQIAMNEDVIPVAEAHQIADTAFDLAQEMGIKITRSIARTYVVRDGEIIRTANRHDKVLPLEDKNLIDVLHEAGVYIVGVGKPTELVPSSYWDKKIKLNNPSQLDPSLGLQFVHPKEKDTNLYTIQGTINALKEVKDRPAYIFSNCVDTDSLWGHTQQVEGSLRSIQEVDRCLPLIVDEMSIGDLLIITADHGMLHAGDREYHPHLKGTQFQDYGYHHNEPVPLLVMKKGDTLNRASLPTTSFAVVGYLAAQTFGVEDKYLACCTEEFRAEFKKE